MTVSSGMNGWLLIRRAVATHRVAVTLIALVVGVGAFLGAAGPRWVEDRLDETAQATVADAGPAAQISARDQQDLVPSRFDGELAGLSDIVEPELASLLGTGRWSASFSPRTFLTHNGVALDEPRRPRRLDVRVPDELAGRVRVVAGELPSSVDSDGRAAFVDVVATRAVAEALRLDVGDVVTFEQRRASGIEATDDPAPTQLPGIRLSGLVEAVDPDDPLWGDARTALSPDPGAPGSEPRITTGTLLTDRELATGWAVTTGERFDIEWHVPIEASNVTAAQIDAVTAELRQLSTATMWSSGLVDALSAYPAQRNAAEGVVAFGVVSLAALCVALALLAVRLLADWRAEEVALARARGADDTALARLLAADAAVVAIPAAVLGAVAALVVLPGSRGWLALALPAGPVIAAVVALPLMALHQVRQAGLGGAAQRGDVAATHPSARRLVAEAAVVVLAGLGLWLAGTRAPGAGVDPVVALAPLLAAGAAGLVIFRAMPYVIAAMLPGLRRARTLTPFLAVTRTARAPGHAVLPVIALLVAVGVATFGGTVQASVEQARETSSWNDVFGDALVQSDVIRVDPAQIGSIPGADAVATGYLFASQRPINRTNGRAAGVDILAVDVDAWQDVTSAAAQPPEVVAAMSGQTRSGAPAAVLKGSVDVIGAGDQLEVTLGEHQVTVEVVETFQDVPGATSGTTLVIPLEPVAEATPGWPHVVYVSGGAVTAGGIATTLGIDTDAVTLRSDVLRSIYGDAVLDAVLSVFAIVTVLSAALAAVAAILGLAIGERTRTYGLSILRTLGLTTRQSAVLTASDIVPISVVAAIAGIGMGTGVGIVTAGALDLPALSGALVGGTEAVSDLPAAVLSAAIVLGIVLAAVAVTVVVTRRARLGAVLRAGEPT